MAKLAISTEVNLKLKLFTSLGRYNDKKYLHIFKSASLETTGMQS